MCSSAPWSLSSYHEMISSFPSPLSGCEGSGEERPSVHLSSSSPPPFYHALLISFQNTTAILSFLAQRVDDEERVWSPMMHAGGQPLKTEWQLSLQVLFLIKDPLFFTFPIIPLLQNHNLQSGPELDNLYEYSCPELTKKSIFFI